jgi:predicted metalloprotease
MRWQGRRKSDNLEDRRAVSASGSRGSRGGMLNLLPMVYKLLGVKGTLLLLLGVGAYAFFSGNLGGLFTMIGLQQNTHVSRSATSIHETPEEKELVDFVSVILADTEDTWTSYFQKKGQIYKPPRLVLFRDAVDSACGMAQSATGPFYCPRDQQVYIDLGFYEQLKNRYKAPGDFAQAYVIAHEVGHHIQKLLGISAKVHKIRKNLGRVEANRLSVRQELQADCLAGVWAYHADKARHLLEVGDLEEGLAAASAIGDDTLQRQSKGYVSPDSFTHGSSAQRVKWFKIGFESGDIGSCNTFKN